MFDVKVTGGRYQFYSAGVLLFIHQDDAPFATAVRIEKIYRMEGGIARTEAREVQRIPLTEVSLPDDRTAVFSAGGHRLTVTAGRCIGGTELVFSGEEGYAYEFCLPAWKDEAVFGGGEQYRQTNLRGETVVNFVAEHTKPSVVRQKALLPSFLYRTRQHSDIGTYAPMPLFVTDRGRMILFETSSDGYASFGETVYLFSFDRCPSVLKLLQGQSYRELAGYLAWHIPNRQFLPDWCYDGMILGIQGGSQTVLDKTFAMLDAGARICGVWCQDWCGENLTTAGKQVWWNWEADESLYPDLRGTILRLRERGVRFLAYLNPYLVKDGRLYELCRRKGYLITRRDGSVYHIRSTTFDAGMLDLTNPEAVTFIKVELIRKNMLDLGISGWMADFGEYLPTDCVLHSGDAALLHNEWPVLWAKINREAVDEYGDPDIMFFSRSGYLGIQSWAPVMWNGDQHPDFSVDFGMPCVMPASFSLGFSGVTAVHCDIGGFFSQGKIRRDSEIFTRWMEMAAFSLMMRSHESLRPWANAQFDAEDVKEHTVRLSGIHRALKPYLKDCMQEASEGIPVLCPDFWEAMDYSSSRDEYSYFLGEDLFVCPVIEKGKRKRKVWLPEGNWVDLWTGEKFTGGKKYTVPAPLGRIPVFYRKKSRYAKLFRSIAEQYPI